MTTQQLQRTIESTLLRNNDILFQDLRLSDVHFARKPDIDEMLRASAANLAMVITEGKEQSNGCQCQICQDADRE